MCLYEHTCINLFDKKQLELGMWGVLVNLLKKKTFPSNYTVQICLCCRLNATTILQPRLCVHCASDDAFCENNFTQAVCV